MIQGRGGEDSKGDSWSLKKTEKWGFSGKRSLRVNIRDTAPAT